MKAESGAAVMRQRVELPVVDTDRVMPENFEPPCKEAYMALPPEALPRGTCTGKYSYTIPAPPNCEGKIEVLLRSKAFFLHRKKASGAKARPGVPPSVQAGELHIGNTISWSKFASVKDAYVFAWKQLGWPTGDLA